MNTEITLFAALLIGLFSSVHCFAMCGGIATLLSNQTNNTIRQPWQNLLYTITSNLGRITSYVLLGAIAGLLSTGLALAVDVVAIADIMRIVTGLLLILVGLQMASSWKGLRFIEIIGKPIWNTLAPLAQKLLPITTLRAAFCWGMLWGWLPCSMVYTLLVMALASGDVLSGSFIMLAFGLGTLPALVLTGIAAVKVSKLLKLNAIKSSVAILFFILGAWILAMPYFGNHSAHQGQDAHHHAY